MSLNIKNRSAEDAVRALVAITGESQATAIEVAARERLQRIRSAAGGDARAALIATIQERVHATGTVLSTDALYDAEGLPQ